ncbi:discoidin domain-containing protein [Paenibacillus sp. FSL K6-3182]|uniref:discoidin domain-containing protein n=1 Tax=Paenibacillus sp. FSL K6-3182 TaxID=2921495 RepID=UPI0030CCC239
MNKIAVCILILSIFLPCLGIIGLEEYKVEASETTNAEDGYANIALGSRADSSSHLGINTAVKAVDGDLNTGWVAANATFPQTIIVDLDAISTLGVVKQHFQTDTTWYYRIEGSNQNTPNSWSWSILADRTQSGVNGSIIEEIVQGRYRFVRLVITGSGDGSPASSMELEVKGETYAQPRDLVPTPVPVDTGDKIVVAQSCNLWGSRYFWESTNPVLYPERTPLMGYYDENYDVSTDWQIKMAVENGIDGLFSCWFRQKGNGGKAPVMSSFDGLTHSLANSAQHREYLKWAIQWENSNDSADGVSDINDFLNNVVPFWIEEYFSKSNYLKVEGKPIVSIYSLSKFISDVGGEENAKNAITQFRQAVAVAGYPGVILMTAENTNTTQSFAAAKEIGIDYIYSYHIPTFMDTYPTDANITSESYVQSHIDSWNNFDSNSEVPYIMTVSSGWDARPWGTSAPVWEIPPNLYEGLLDEAKTRMNSKSDGNLGGRLLLLDNWNEYAEGHYIAPTEKYGFDYINAIRRIFSDATTEPDNLLPNKNQIPQLLTIKNATSLTVTTENGADTIPQPYGTLQMDYQTEPLGDNGFMSVKWEVYEMDGVTPTTKASISGDGLLTAKSNGQVKVVVTDNSQPELKGEKIITISNQPENLARGKTVTASTYADYGAAGIYYPSNAVDGNMDSWWLVDGVQYPSWLQVDLGEPKALGTIIQYAAVPQTYKFKIEGSLDGENWVLMVDRSIVGVTGEKIKEVVNGNYRYVKMTFLQANAWPSSKEFEIYGSTGEVIPDNIPVAAIEVSGEGGTNEITLNGQSLQMIADVLPANATNKAVAWSVWAEDGKSPTDVAFINNSGLLYPNKNGTVLVRAEAGDGSGVMGTVPVNIIGQKVNLAYKKQATASEYANYGGDALFSPDLAVDGNLETRWLVDGVKYPSWFKVDLGEKYSLTHVFQWFADTDIKTYKYKIEGSANGSDWETLVDRMNDGMQGPMITEEVEGIYRYVRMTLTDANAWPSSREFKVWGEALPPSEGEKPTGHPGKSTITTDVKLGNSSLQVPVTREKNDNNQTVVRVPVTADVLAQAFSLSKHSALVLEVQNTDPVVKVDIPASALLDAAEKWSDAGLLIKVAGASYLLPAKIAKNIPGYTKITITITKLAEETADAIKSRVAKMESMQMLASPVDFKVEYDGKEATDFGGIYISRTLSFAAASDISKVTAVWVDDDNGLHFMPSVISREDDRFEITIFSPHNSIYTVIESERSFNNLVGHWASEDVKLLANKLIINGITNKEFVPDASITRAQFAALLVRSLGLSATVTDLKFSDIRGGTWFSGSVGAASKAGIINGYEDGSFRPHDTITREQMAVMIARAIEFTGKMVNPAEFVLDPFADQGDISDWALESVAINRYANVMQGLSDSTFSPKEEATRAQAVTILKRMLQYLQFIN